MNISETTATRARAQVLYVGNRQGNSVAVALPASEVTPTIGGSSAVTSANHDEKGHRAC